MYAKTHKHGSVCSPDEGRGNSRNTLKMASTTTDFPLRIEQNSLCQSVMFSSQQEITDSTLDNLDPNP